MIEYECSVESGCLKYRIDQEGICITGYQGRDWMVELPQQIEGRPVTAIDRKTFLGRKNLREIRLPVSLRRVGDWAFAYCDNLERVFLPVGCTYIGRALFLNCGHLDCVAGICLGNSPEGAVKEAWPLEIGRLLGAAVTWLDAYYLLEPSAVGSEEWLRKWDMRLEAVMRAGDQEGYSKQVLCGEEDYGSTDLNAYLQTQRQKKVRLAMLRLLCDEGLSNGMREYLADYLISHTQGCPSEESWQVVLEEGEERSDYVQIFLQLGCATRDNIEVMIRQTGEVRPQLRAAFLRYQQEQLGHKDFFAGLSL